mgnify:FL=1
MARKANPARVQVTDLCVTWLDTTSKPTPAALQKPDAIIPRMTFLQSLRNAHRLTRFMLVWFALFIGVAVASPLVKPQAAQMVCSAMGGMKMVVLGDLGDIDRSSDGMDCPLCTQVSAPPTPVFTGFAPPSALAHALRPIAQAHIAWLSGSPLPPRGPPVFS